MVSLALLAYFFFLALLIGNIWVSPILIFVWVSGIVIPIYYRYRFRHSSKAEKERMVAQKSLSSYYYRKWYTPADSSLLENEVEKAKKIKKIR